MTQFNIRKCDTNIYSFLLTEENAFLVSDEVIQSKRFAKDIDLKAVILPANLKTIENESFKNCSELKEAYIDLKKSGLENENCDNNEFCFETINCGINELKYIFPKHCNDNQNVVIRPNSFLNCTKLHTVLLPPCGNLIIEKSAFENCSALRTVLILCNHAQIHENAFAGCENVVLVSNCEEVLSFARNNNLEQINVR